MMAQERAEILRLISDGNVGLQVRAILQATAERYRVTVERMLSVLKIAAVSHARQMAIYAIRELVVGTDGRPLSYPKIAAVFDRDHSTIIYAWSVIDAARRNGRRIEVDDHIRRMKVVISRWRTSTPLWNSNEVPPISELTSPVTTRTNQ